MIGSAGQDIEGLKMTEIIAEIGVNHNGDVAEAIKLVNAAKAAGADVAKFQWSFPAQEIARRYEPVQFAMVQSLTLPWGHMELIAKHCAKIGIEFMCTPADRATLALLLDRKIVSRIKIGSDNLTNLPLLRDVAACNLPVILSTGMATFDEIKWAIDILIARRGADLTLLHCTSAYPCPIGSANLNAITALCSFVGFRASVGWSDHTTSLTLPAVAVGMDAVIIEKHLTLDVSAVGPDHAASLDPDQFKIMVAAVREAEKAMGDGDKRPLPCERLTIKHSRKSVVAACDIAKGEPFTDGNLAIKRPGYGPRPALAYDDLLGAEATRDYTQDEMID
jgi:sialic acid synthase SpsE